MNLTVLGAAGATGGQLVEQALAADHLAFRNDWHPRSDGGLKIQMNRIRSPELATRFDRERPTLQ